MFMLVAFASFWLVTVSRENWMTCLQFPRHMPLHPPATLFSLSSPKGKSKISHIHRPTWSIRKQTRHKYILPFQWPLNLFVWIVGNNSKGSIKSVKFVTIFFRCQMDCSLDPSLKCMNLHIRIPWNLLPTEIVIWTVKVTRKVFIFTLHAACIVLVVVKTLERLKGDIS